MRVMLCVAVRPWARTTDTVTCGSRDERVVSDRLGTMMCGWCEGREASSCVRCLALHGEGRNKKDGDAGGPEAWRRVKVRRRGLSPSQLLSVQRARTSRLQINAPCRCSISDTDSAVLQVGRRMARWGGGGAHSFASPFQRAGSAPSKTVWHPGKRVCLSAWARPRPTSLAGLATSSSSLVTCSWVLVEVVVAEAWRAGGVVRAHGSAMAEL